MKLLLLALAGALGTLLRYGVSSVVQRHAGLGFPWGTFAVNMAGCFLFGLLWSLFENRFEVSRDIRAIVLVGFLGGFTTFSSFAFEGAGLLREGAWLSATGHLLGQNVLGVLLVFLGLAAGRHG
jgi:CrcB protein